jgi:hypothetical protein
MGVTMIRRLSLILLLAAALALSAAAPAPAMTPEAAGTYYLASVCPINPALDRVDQTLFRGHATVRPRQLHGRRLRQVRRALAILQRAELRSVNRLSNPPSEWPDAASTAAVASAAFADNNVAKIITRLRHSAGRRFVRIWNHQFEPQAERASKYSALARQSLGLPPPPQGC